ncbi:copper homeostasis protein CutC [Sediminibacterium ginsengisoli]|uniref:PF03932 family protein CutC n=1 Tax=Sediminibacterium ginsengisoli TaxID=413434 RepID=A0A1T4PN91_9BACT|nr:copper homeostasis protein CutC [Sediminibacterium ginsengisoli]SJZ93065.1 copper homeostasis protein [Sediminibacterium ginsengisoli]
MSSLLEIAVFNIQAALTAAAAGADRIELCDNENDGGTTPSYGTLKIARERISLPVFPILRPRGGDFFYNEEEFEVMKKDLLLCKELQFEGIVTGLLLQNGQIDTDRTAQLVNLAYPMDVTFHRAFDRAVNPIEALEDIIGCGCSRILTSGQVPMAWDGRELIRHLTEQAGDRIVIMPGSGVRSHNIKELQAYTGATELHSSAKKSYSSSMEYEQVSMQEELTSPGTDPEEIRNMKAALR